MVKTGRSTGGAATGGTGGTGGTTSGGSTPGAAATGGNVSGGTTGTHEGPAEQAAPLPANVGQTDPQDSAVADATDVQEAAEGANGPMVYYPGDQITRAREMSRRDWQRFGVADEDLPEDFQTTRWGPENDWMVPVSKLDAFLTEGQRDAFIQQNGLEVREP